MSPLTGSERADDDLIEAEGLNLRWHNEPEAPERKRGELQRMRTAHFEKIARVQQDYDNHQDSRFLQGLEFEIEQEHPELSAAEVTDEVGQQVAYHNWKRAKIVEIVSICDTEMGFRDAGGKVDRIAYLEAIEADPGQTTLIRVQT